MPHGWEPIVSSETIAKGPNLPAVNAKQPNSVAAIKGTLLTASVGLPINQAQRGSEAGAARSHKSSALF